MRDFIQALPKAELHIHLEGCLSAAQVRSFARRNGLPPPFGDTEAERAAYTPSDLDDFLVAFARAADVLRTAQDFLDLAVSHLDDAASEGVRHVEMMFDPQMHVSRGVPLRPVLDGLCAALADAEHRHGLSALLIMNVMRERDEAEALRLLEEARPWFGRIVAIGIDSAEMGHPPARFECLFARARAMGLRGVAHAGFEGPPDDIAEAVEILRVDRVDHGNRLYERPALARGLAATAMPVTVCPRAEVELGVVSSLEAHPLRRMVRDGLRPSVHPDDPAWFGSITDNLVDVAEALALNQGEVAQLVRNGFTTSFLPPAAVTRHLEAIEAVAREG